MALIAAACGEGDPEAADDGQADPAQEDAEQDDVEPEDAEPDDTDPQDGDLLQVTVVAQPILPALNVHLAHQEGLFEDHGLDVSLEVMRGGPLVSDTVQAGDADIGGMNFDGVIVARDRGFDYQLLYPAVLYDSGSPDVYLVGRADAGFDAVEDLEGSSIALALGEIPEWAVTALLTEHGVDPDSVEFVDIPFPDMVGALEAGTVDAAHIVEPFLSSVLDQGIAEIIAPDLDVVGDRFLVHTWFAREEWIQQNEEAAERFTAALAETTEWILDDPDAVLPAAANALEMEEDTLANFFPERYVTATSVTPEELEAPIDFNIEWSPVEGPLTYEELVSPYFPLED